MLVLVACLVFHTDVAMSAVEEVFTATKLAHAALGAMKLPLRRVVVVNHALLAEVLSEHRSAFLTALGRRLYCITVVAFDRLHLFNIELMQYPGLLNLFCLSL